MMETLEGQIAHYKAVRERAEAPGRAYEARRAKQERDRRFWDGWMLEREKVARRERQLARVSSGSIKSPLWGSMRHDVRLILAQTCRDHGISVDEVLIKTRGSKAVYACRQDAINRIRKAGLKFMSLAEIGRQLGRDHTSILSAIGTLASRRKP